MKDYPLRDIPKDTYERAKKLAAMQNLSLNQYLILAVSMFVEAQWAKISKKQTKGKSK